MRDYLKLYEIESVLTDILEDHHEVRDFMDLFEQQADICLCAAHSSSECCCGAWDE